MKNMALKGFFIIGLFNVIITIFLIDVFSFLLRNHSFLRLDSLYSKFPDIYKKNIVSVENKSEVVKYVISQNSLVDADVFFSDNSTPLALSNIKLKDIGLYISTNSGADIGQVDHIDVKIKEGNTVVKEINIGKDSLDTILAPPLKK